MPANADCGSGPLAVLVVSAYINIFVALVDLEKNDISMHLMRSETFNALVLSFLLSSTRNKGQSFTNALLFFPPFGANIGKCVICGISEPVLNAKHKKHQE